MQGLYTDTLRTGLGGGHYTAVCKNADNGEWYKFDDSRVNHTTVENAQVGPEAWRLCVGGTLTHDMTPQSSGAYLLFYRRRTEQPLGGERLAQLHVSLEDHPVQESAFN